MNSTTTRLARTFGLSVLLTALALAFTGAAYAVDDDPPDPDDPPQTLTRPNLTVTGSVAAVGTAEWEIRYTVTNRGNAAAKFFRVDVHQNGTALLKSTLHPGLEPGTSRSEVLRFPRTANCYLPVRFTADSAGVVGESSETDNVTWAIGLTDTACATQPRYQVKAVSFQAVDETGFDWAGSDEPFWIFNSVGMEGTSLTTRSRVFGDVDTGDTATFGPTEGCLYLSCSGGQAPLGMGFSIHLWEKDLGYVNETLASYAAEWQRIGGYQPGVPPIDWLNSAIGKLGDVVAYVNSWAADDHVGAQTYLYQPVYLASRLPAVGSSFTDTRTYTGGGGTYTLTTLVTRVG